MGQSLVGRKGAIRKQRGQRGVGAWTVAGVRVDLCRVAQPI
jgi:hypothetical protein